MRRAESGWGEREVQVNVWVMVQRRQVDLSRWVGGCIVDSSVCRFDSLVFVVFAQTLLIAAMRVLSARNKGDEKCEKSSFETEQF